MRLGLVFCPYLKMSLTKSYSFFQVVTQEPRDDSQQKLELEKLNGELSNAKQEIKNLQSDLKLVEEDKIQHRIMKGKLDKFARMEKQIESLRIENKLLNDTADNSQLLKEQVHMYDRVFTTAWPKAI